MRYNSVHEARGTADTAYKALIAASVALDKMEDAQPTAVFKDAHVSKALAGDHYDWWVRLVEKHGERDD